jgi:ferritin-like protein
MSKDARELVEKAGIDADRVVELLLDSAGAELNAVYYYTLLRANLVGPEGAAVKEATETARIEHRNHFEALIPRIFELGGTLPLNLKDFHDQAAWPPAVLPADPEDLAAMLSVLAEAERSAVRSYTQLCDITAAKDHRTHDLCLAILHEETEHESWFAALLGEKPSGHRRRGEPSPFVGRFLK